MATGTGDVAIPLARAGHVVTGVDIATNLLVQASQRAAAAGLTANFDEGDAEHLPYPNGSFDAVFTMFGAMFAPRPELVSAEFARVLRPGGKLYMANWNPEGFSGAMFRVMGRHAQPPLGIQPYVLWGDSTTAKKRLSHGFTDVTTTIVPVDFDMPTSPAETVAFFRRWFGPTEAAYKRLDPAGQDALTRDLIALWSEANVSPDPGSHTLIRNEYLQVTATRL